MCSGYLDFWTLKIRRELIAEANEEQIHSRDSRA